MSYSYIRPITINASKCGSSNSVNFPVCFNPGALAYLAVTGSGGKVTSGSGFDIVFTSDAFGNTLLPFEIESWVSTTGAIVAHVQLPVVSSSVNTTFYLCYSNSAITTFQGGAAGSVWDSNFKGVYHLTSGGGADSTSNGNTGTPTSVSSVAGEVGTGGSFNGSTSVVNIAQTSGLPIYSTAGYSVSFWVNAINNSAQTVFSENSGTSGTSVIQFYNSSSNPTALEVQIRNQAATMLLNSVPSTSSIFITAHVWNHVTWTDLNGAAKLYVNGVQDASNFNYTPAGTFTLVKDTIGAIGRTAGPVQPFAGSIDEVRLSNSVRSADWVKTEYNNQSSPSTFYTIGSLTQTILATMSTFAGSTVKSTNKGISASAATFTGSTIKSANKTVAASLSAFSGGSSLKSIQKLLIASMNSCAAGLSRNANKSIQATTAPMSGKLIKVIDKTINAVLANLSSSINFGISTTLKAVMSSWSAILGTIQPLPQPDRIIYVPAYVRTMFVPATNLLNIRVTNLQKYASDDIDYPISWLHFLTTTGATPDIVVSAVWHIPSGLTVTNESISTANTITTVSLSGGVVGEIYSCSVQATTAQSRVREFPFTIEIIED